MILLLLKVTLLFALVLALAGPLRRSSAAMRHLVCACGLAGALLLLLSLLVPVGTPALRMAALAVPSTARLVRGVPGWGTPVLRILPWLWLAGTALLLARLALGYRRVATFVSQADGADIAFADVSVPVVVGLSRATILLPRAAEAWPAERMDAALRHERAHVRRGDLWTLLLSHLACAVYWFHPLVWMVAAQLRREQEQACDDAVILSGFAPAVYAEALVAAAQNLTSTRLTGCHMLTQKTFRSRVARLLADSKPRASSSTTLKGAAVACVVAIVAIGLVNARAQSPDESGVYKMGPGISAPSVLSRVDPEYSEQARAEKVDGPVLLAVVIGIDGMAHDVNVVKGIGSGLDEKAVEAIQKWHFRPGTKNGEPVPVRAQIEVNFRLM